MIRAHMATYPRRRELLERALRSIAPQVDRVFLVLNEYDAVPDAVAGIANVEPILPDSDLKDVGKFLTSPAADDHVVFVDDDLIYPAGFVAGMIAAAEGIGLDRGVFGYHGSIYTDIEQRGAMGREVHALYRKLSATTGVDQLATCAMLALGRNVAPFDYMAGSQKFVDVRYARWLHAQGIDSWCLAHPRRFVEEMRVSEGKHETIYKSFTVRSPDHVVAEIQEFAGKGRFVGLVRQAA